MYFNNEKKGGKDHGKCHDINRSGTGQNSTFQTQGTPLLATKLSVQHNFIQNTLENIKL